MKKKVVRESFLRKIKNFSLSSWQNLWGRSKDEGISIDRVAASPMLCKCSINVLSCLYLKWTRILRTSQESFNQSNRLCIHEVSFTTPKLADVKLYFQSGGHIIWPWSTTAYLDLNAGWWAVTRFILPHYKTCQKQHSKVQFKQHFPHTIT